MANYWYGMCHVSGTSKALASLPQIGGGKLESDGSLDLEALLGRSVGEWDFWVIRRTPTEIVLRHDNRGSYPESVFEALEDRRLRVLALSANDSDDIPVVWYRDEEIFEHFIQKERWLSGWEECTEEEADGFEWVVSDEFTAEEAAAFRVRFAECGRAASY